MGLLQDPQVGVGGSFRNFTAQILIVNKIRFKDKQGRQLLLKDHHYLPWKDKEIFANMKQAGEELWYGDYPLPHPIFHRELHRGF